MEPLVTTSSVIYSTNCSKENFSGLVREALFPRASSILYHTILRTLTVFSVYLLGAGLCIWVKPYSEEAMTALGSLLNFPSSSSVCSLTEMDYMICSSDFQV